MYSCLVGSWVWTETCGNFVEENGGIGLGSLGVSLTENTAKAPVTESEPARRPTTLVTLGKTTNPIKTARFGTYDRTRFELGHT